MARRRFGRTGIDIPVFSCGGMRYQQSWKDLPLDQINTDNQTNLEATIERSLELGINHIETARGYGTSEVQLGQLLPRYPREELIIQTKVSPREDAVEFSETVEQSLKLLRLDYVDFLSIHGINNEATLDWTMRKSGCLAAARQFQREGRCRFIGFSTHGDCPLICRTIGTGAFDYVNLHWYYIFQWNQQAIEEAHGQNMGVFIISPNDKGGMLYKPSARLMELCQPLHPMEFNDLFCLRNPKVHTLSLGASRPSDFDTHVDILSRLHDPQGSIGEIEKRLDAALDAVADEVPFLKTLPESIPSFDTLPGNVNARIIILLWWLDRAFDMPEYAQFRYNLLGNADHWFPGQKAGSMDTASMRDALADCGDPDTAIDILRQSHERFNAGEGRRLSESD
jgi:predicted aldo/keto reductase-like oxidoreductase